MTTDHLKCYVLKAQMQNYEPKIPSEEVQLD